MLVVLLVLLTFALLVGIVIGLRRYQLRENETNADRQSPLPPLDLHSVAPLQDEEESLQRLQIPDEPVDRPQALTLSDASAVEQDTDEDIVPPAVSSVNPPATSSDIPSGSPPPINANWLEACNRLKSEERYEEALEACETAMPQAGAFNQAATILRAQIRQYQKKGRDISPLLDDLYLVASYASFLHDKQSDLPVLTAHQIKQLPGSAWQLDMPYREIGYRRLRLLNKSDLKLIRDTWGEPDGHQDPRQYHQASWMRLVQAYGR